ncbi:MAG: GTP-binding protein [Candidatus Asgardarchaeia archaeon]
MKIYVTGPFNAGKTTLIHKLAPNATSIEHYYNDGTSTTVGFDLGTIYWDTFENKILKKIPNSHNDTRYYKIILVGTPGQMQFAPVREILAKGCQGVLFLIDSTNIGQVGVALAMYEEVKSYFKKDFPMVILANKQDLENAADAETIRKLLKLDNVRIIEGSALKEINIEEALLELLNMIIKQKDAMTHALVS